jgi:hypothetical protein
MWLSLVRDLNHDGANTPRQTGGHPSLTSDQHEPIGDDGGLDESVLDNIVCKFGDSLEFAALTPLAIDDDGLGGHETEFTRRH